MSLFSNRITLLCVHVVINNAELGKCDPAIYYEKEDFSKMTLCAPKSIGARTEIVCPLLAVWHSFRTRLEVLNFSWEAVQSEKSFHDLFFEVSLRSYAYISHHKQWYEEEPDLGQVTFLDNYLEFLLNSLFQFLLLVIVVVLCTIRCFAFCANKSDLIWAKV